MTLVWGSFEAERDERMMQITSGAFLADYLQGYICNWVKQTSVVLSFCLNNWLAGESIWEAWIGWLSKIVILSPPKK